MGLKKSQTAVSLFDVRVKSNDRDIILLRGTQEEAASVVLNGNVVLSVVESIPIKRINLKLQGVLRLHWTDSVLTSRGPGSRPVKYEKIVYEHEWPNLASGHLSNHTTPNHSRSPSRSVSSVSLASLGKAKSTGNLVGLGGHSNNHSFSGLGLSSMAGNSSSGATSSSSSSTFRLSEGNHEFPFEVVLPGDMIESLEGMEGGQIIYRLTCVIERAGMFSNSIVCKKHIRIIRTVGSDSFDLSQTVSIENTWPKKVEYAISVPSKAVAIGSYTPVDIIMQPLLKGLKLGRIKVHLAEHVTLSTPLGQTTSRERIAHEVTLPAPEDGFEGRDSWEIHEMLPLPTSLSKCSQDCSIGSYVKVAHKLKFAISLLNPDGHTSELRASLPIYLFISPSVQITSVDPTVLHHTGYPEDTLFGSEPNSRHGSALNLRALHSEPSAVQMDADAPPTYHDHVYDRLWSEHPSEPSSPEASGYTTPHLGSSRRNSISDDLQHLGMVSVSAEHRSQLAAGLRALERGERYSTSPNGSASNTPYPLPLHSQGSSSDYFSLPHGAGSSATAQHFYHGFNSPEMLHLSRAGTPLPSSPGTPSMEPQELESLSKVPSYQTALKNDVDSDTELAPIYKDDTIVPGSSAGSASGSNSASNSATNSGGGSGNSSYLAVHSPSRPLPSHQSQMRSLSNTRNNSSSGLAFLNRNHSSRSLMEEASRLVRLNDKGKNKHV